MISLPHNAPLMIGFLIISVVMGALHRRLSSSASFIALLYCLPFTFMHELAHFVVALLTGGRPSSFSILPVRSGGRWVLGSVRAVPTLLSAAPTALAPLGWLVIGYYLLLQWDFRPLWVPGYLLIIVLYACSAACTPSFQDLKVALGNPFSLVLWAGVVYVVIQLWPIMEAGAITRLLQNVS